MILMVLAFLEHYKLNDTLIFVKSQFKYVYWLPCDLKLK